MSLREKENIVDHQEFLNALDTVGEAIEMLYRASKVLECRDIAVLGEQVMARISKLIRDRDDGPGVCPPAWETIGGR